MKQYLIDTFKYNDFANRKVLEKIRELPDQTEGVRLFSHLINSMNKWIARIDQYPQMPRSDWWTPLYPLDQLEAEWGKCLQAWLRLLDAKTEDELFADVRVVADNGASYGVALKDIALQLNYHSIHHRANIQAIIRARGFEPDFVDYIGTVSKRTD